jgi:hypothetical protein
MATEVQSVAGLRDLDLCVNADSTAMGLNDCCSLKDLG